MTNHMKLLTRFEARIERYRTSEVYRAAALENRLASAALMIARQGK